jgi:hypothetical protein
MEHLLSLANASNQAYIQQFQHRVRAGENTINLGNKKTLRIR